MTKRPLSQFVLWFLLGMASSYLGVFTLPSLVLYVVGILWYVAGFYLQYRKLDFSEKLSGKRLVFFFLIPLCLCIFVGISGFLQREKQHRRIQETESYLKNHSDITVIGRIYKKEVKKKQILYYLKDANYVEHRQNKKCNRVQVSLNADPCLIDDLIAVKGNGTEFSEAVNEGGFQEKEYYYSKNILFSMEAKEIQILQRARIPWKESLYQWRKRISKVYEKLLPKQEAGILGVMTLGEKSLLEQEAKELYQDSGISHVLAISGLHVSVIGMGMYGVLRKIGISYLGAGMIAGIFILGFGQLSGMEISTIRAISMFLLLLFSNMIGMCYDSITALSFCALLNLWENPWNLTNSGFLFSYSAVVAIVVVAATLQGEKQPLEEKKEKKVFWGKERILSFLEACKNSFLIQLTILPLTAFFYYEFPVYSIFINGILLPFLGIILSLGLLSGILGLLWLPAGKLLMFPVFLLLSGIKYICYFFQQLPGGMWMIGRPSLFCMGLYYFFLIIALLYVSRKKSIFLEKRIVTFLLTVALFLTLTIRDSEITKICFLDVGQGDGIYLQSKEGASFFLDGGSTSRYQVGKYTILNFFKYHGRTNIDGWFLSHLDEDHISGLLEVWEEGYSVKNLFLSEYVIRDESWKKICFMAKTYGTKITYLNKGDCITQGDITLTCLFPWEEEQDKNDSSMVLYVKCGKNTALFTGDISSTQEEKLLQEYPDLKIDLYKAAHHGSNHSNGSSLLEQIRPAITVISCGRNNSYGHPGKETIKRLEACGSKIYYTMESGQVTVEFEEGKMFVSQYRK